ncbi:twin transmembrane helix small protein [Reyranella aquatilis]|jgi:hypothetical protein|uniref:Twin transmembrane helix small protein n=1 Tax=Reyranella aquatilis TaxID=2035356 RepID=A0ABS8KQJ6_9HYPH|nr:twin transmembrane helix small protein [Reyranella aquatilis]MCC8428338.1 twin transmembrane helix small protein [Reyranella aquatilis]
MTLANVLFVLVLVSAFATLGTLFAGLINMSQNQDANIEGSRRSNKFMWWRVRLQLLTVVLILLWYFASRS